MSVIGAETALVMTWIKQRFAANAAALDTLYSGLSSRVFEDVAPQDTPYPFIVVQFQDLPRVVRGVGSAEVMVDTICVVKAVAQTTEDSVLAPIANLIHDTLVENNGEAVSGGLGDVYMCRFLQAVRVVEPAQGSQFRHLGGAFQIQAKAA